MSSYSYARCWERASHRSARLLLGLIAIAALLCVGTANANSQEAKPIKLQVYTGGTMFLTDIAKHLNLFKKNGLDAEMVVVQTGPQATQALASGSVDIALVTPLNVASLIEAGREVKVAINQQPAFLSVLTSKELTANTWPESLTQLKGKRMGILALGAADHGICEAAVIAAGLEKGDVDFVATGTVQGTAAALKQGSVDSVCVNPFATTVLKNEGFPIVFSLFQPVQEGENYSDEIKSIIRLPYIQSWARAGLGEEKPEVLSAYQKSIAMAYDWASDPANFDALVEFLRDSNYNIETLDDDQYREYVGLILAAQGVTFSDQNMETWNGLVKGITEVDLSDAGSWLAQGVPQDDAATAKLVSE